MWFTLDNSSVQQMVFIVQHNKLHYYPGSHFHLCGFQLVPLENVEEKVDLIHQQCYFQVRGEMRLRLMGRRQNKNRHRFLFFFSLFFHMN